MNQTPNYQLNQWDAEDKVLRTDFNADNEKIDAALKAEADARADADSALNAALNVKGNCQIYVHRYTGTGTYNWEHPSSITFPAQPVLVFMVELVRYADGSFNSGGITAWTAWGAEHVYMCTGGSGEFPVTWSGNTMSWYMNDSAISQFNNKDGSYVIVALLAADE